MMDMLRMLAVMLTVGCASNLFANEDWVITRDDSGKLVGLPDRYNPAALNIGVKKETETGDSPDISLEVGNKKLNFPPCVSRYFPAMESAYNLTLSSSSSLQIYIDVINASYSYMLSFDLATLEPRNFMIGTRVPGENGSYLHQLTIDERCLSQIKENME